MTRSMDYEPPFLETYKTLLEKQLGDSENDHYCSMVNGCEELPLIDLERLNLEHPERDECMKEICEAASKWGFFQVINHGISEEIIKKMQLEQKKLFYQPFVKKCEEAIYNLSAKTYRWGNPCATSLQQVSWSEAFHFSLTDLSIMDQHITLRSSLEAFGRRMTTLAESLAEILTSKLDMKYSNFFQEKCGTKSSFIRLNRYPPCPISSKVYGLLPHNDTSFLTILYQDRVGGLQLMKDGKWVDLKPNPQALVVNIGDFFQALSNSIYKSIKHRVVADHEMVERFSMAFFYCPSEDAVIQCHNKPAIYKKFTMKEYREQNEKDVKQTGNKVGLTRFML